jgi:pimeloyl-ACP methyl ester carboxylesterase
MCRKISGSFVGIGVLSALLGGLRAGGRRRVWVGVVAVVAALAVSVTAFTGVAVASTARDERRPAGALSDEALVRSLRGGFRNGYARVNGTRLHYVIGGRGTPLVLLPGWPQTWWEFHKVMPALAARHRVIAVDLRGMGGSDKPATGYDKKTMAKDVFELVHRLGYSKVDIAGHDIGSMVAFSFAANHPDATRKVAMLDVPHPHQGFYGLRLLPPSGWRSPPPYYLWWFAFNQVRGLPERLVSGRSRQLVDWILDYLAMRPASIGDHARAVYARAYSSKDAIRAGNGWYQTFGQDIVDQRGYGRVTAPILGLGGEGGYPSLRAVLPSKGTDVRVVRVANSGHFLAEERPDAVIDWLTRFFG